MIVFAPLLFAAAGSIGAATADIPEPNPKTMSQAEIRKFNETVDSKHPYYIRCKRTAATGSLVARQFSCRTNEQWALADVRGNQEARDIMDDMTSKGANTSN